MNEEDRNALLELANGCLDGQMNVQQRDALEAWIESDAEARRVVADYFHTHAALHWNNVHMSEQGNRDFLLLADPVDELISKPSEQKFLMRSLLAMAAVIAIFVGLAGTYFWNTQSQTGPALVDQPVLEKIDPVARVSRIEGGDLGSTREAVLRGTELGKGALLEMTDGMVEIHFYATDVQLVATAPFSFEITSTDLVRLNYGQLELDVPPQGIGFVVETKERKITDLGTRFVVSSEDELTKVLVLEGEVLVEQEGESQLMVAAEMGHFSENREGQIWRNQVEDNHKYGKISSLPELSLAVKNPAVPSLMGEVMSLAEDGPKAANHSDQIGIEFLSLVRSGFEDSSRIQSLRKGEPVLFSGIAGHYHHYSRRVGLSPYGMMNGWMAWFQGKVMPPRKGRYRFWGVADNHLLVAIDGKPIFEGGRMDSAFRRELGIKRLNNPCYPFMNIKGGMACSEWFSVDDKPIQMDILFGERDNYHTRGLLLIEREGETYEESYWGQPLWPVFLTEWPSLQRQKEFSKLQYYLQNEMNGAFSINENEVWQVSQD